MAAISPDAGNLGDATRAEEAQSAPADVPHPMRWQVPATVALAVLLVATVTFHARGLSEAPRETGNLRGADFSNGTAFWLLIPAQPGDVVRIERWPFAGLPNMPLDLLVIEGVELEHVLAGGEPHVLYARMPPPPPQVSHQECYATGLCLGWVSADDNPEPAPLEVRRSQPKWLPPLPSDRAVTVWRRFGST
ncbi:MAG TPA: hypothetical protein VFH47_03185, partial [Candidatus Thermoplasmatota archaeon]|nr:hypothetical protein [Candidatus Thermoplasmatota archaeon]